MNKEFIILLAITVTILGVILSLVIHFLNRKMRKQAEYNEDQKKILLESVRDSLERQMYALNDRMVVNEVRWKDVNHLLLNNQYIDTYSDSLKTQVNYSDFIQAHGITKNDLLIDDKLIFVLTPYNDKYYEDFKQIKDTCTSIGYKCQRGDEQNFQADIFSEMLRLIVKSKIIIANINGRNPNVMYELGIAQALGKYVILVSQSPKEIPIDIQSKKIIIYRNHTELDEMLRSELKRI